MDKKYNFTQLLPLRPNQSSLKKFPTEAFSLVLREMILAIAKSTETDPAMAGTAMLSSISYCLSSVFRICAKRDHIEPLVLYSLIIAEPSSKKSPVMSLLKLPYYKFVETWNENNKQEILRTETERKNLENKILVLEKNNGSCANKIAQIKEKLSNLPSGKFRRIIVDDITPESLIFRMKENGTLCMLSDESGMLANFSGRYNNQIPNLDLLLKCWSGEMYISDRVTRDSIVLAKPYLSVCLACQPYLFENLMSNTAFKGSGLIARFLYCFPDSKIGYRRYDTQSVPGSTKENYRNLIYKLLDFKFKYHEKEEITLSLSTEAYKEFVEYYDNSIEPKLLTDMTFCKDWGGKMHGELLRIAGILHCTKCITDGINPAEMFVDVDTLHEAVKLIEYYRDQAIYAYSLGDVDLGTAKAEKIITVIRAKNIKEIRQNDLYVVCRCKLFRDAQDFTETINMLEEYGYLRRVYTKGSNNKTVTDLIINPETFNYKQNAQNAQNT